MKIDEMLDIVTVERLIAGGYIRERQHPKYPELRILGYTEKAQWERMWSHETLVCRGLIYDHETREVLARPFPKFFNHSEYNQTEGVLAGVELDLHAEVEVSDKADGSLGILFGNPYSGEWEIATRGSFDSDQARKANAEFLPKLLERWTPYHDVTYLFEIVFPENRIVLDYGDWEGLILLGAVHPESGKIEGPRFDDTWPGKRAELFWPSHLIDALQMPPRPNAEGLVIRYVETGQMVKIKQDDYVRLHKIITGLSDKTVWEHLSAHDGDFSAMLEHVPDEFHEWLRGTAQGFLDKHEAISANATGQFNAIRVFMGAPGTTLTKDNVDRAVFAGHAKKFQNSALLFQLLDGRDTSPSVWKMLRPVGARYMQPGQLDG